MGAADTGTILVCQSNFCYAGVQIWNNYMLFNLHIVKSAIITVKPYIEYPAA
jgi:hypothetical protein